MAQNMERGKNTKTDRKENEVIDDKRRNIGSGHSQCRLVPGDIYCCLLPQREALRTCRSGFSIATLLKKQQFHQKKNSSPSRGQAGPV